MKPKIPNPDNDFIPFDNRPVDDEDELYCDPLENRDNGYFSKIKEKQRYNEKNEENNEFFG